MPLCVVAKRKTGFTEALQSLGCVVFSADAGYL